jgi:hypothetical protein
MKKREHSIISLSLKLDDNELLLSFESLIEEEFGLTNELAMLAFNIRMEVCNVLNSFFSFLMKYKEKRNNFFFGFLDARS